MGDAPRAGPRGDLILANQAAQAMATPTDETVEPHELIRLIPELRAMPLTIKPLGGGLTNRNFRLDGNGQSFVLRVPGKDTALLGIDRACEAACSRAAAAMGVGPELIAHLPEQGAIVRRFVTGRVLTAEDVRQPAIMRRLVDALRRYHDGPPGAGIFSPFATVRQYHALARERGVRFPGGLGRALERLAAIEQELSGAGPLCPCHNDLLPANFIDDGGATQIIDWEYGGMGDRFFDLGNLAVNCEFTAGQERALVELYFGEVRATDVRRLRLMRLASDMREAMWGFLQSTLSTLNEDFPGYGRKHLERFLAAPLSLEWFSGTSGAR
jgi:thiamine kinase-like enzyme